MSSELRRKLLVCMDSVAENLKRRMVVMAEAGEQGAAHDVVTEIGGDVADAEAAARFRCVRMRRRGGRSDAIPFTMNGVEILVRDVRIIVQRQDEITADLGRAWADFNALAQQADGFADLAAFLEHDCDVIQGDGGTRTAAITGSFIALVDALAKLKKDGRIAQVPIHDYIAATSVGILGGNLILDLCYEEDSKAEVDMNVIMTGKGEFIEIQGTAERKPFSKDKMDCMLDLAKKGIEELFSIQRKLVGDILL